MSFVSNNFEQVVKVADFGVARVQTESGVMTAETGTYRWMAPEVLLLCLVIFFLAFHGFDTRLSELRSLSTNLMITGQMSSATRLCCGNF